MGTLFVVATPIGNLGDMTPRAVDVLRAVALVAVEDTRHSATIMHHFQIPTPMMSYHKHNQASRKDRLLQELESGDVALISDAGTPAIADPGHDLVKAVIAAGHQVVPVPGASAAIAAVSASGLVPGPFVFLGFISRTGEDRRVVLGKGVSTGFPLVLFESPLRLATTLAEIDGLAPGRAGVVAREVTKLHEEFRRGSLSDLALAYAETPPRGEVVLVVGEHPGSTDSPDSETPELLARAILAQGVKPSKAARELSSITGIGAAEAYDLVRRIGNESRSS